MQVVRWCVAVIGVWCAVTTMAFAAETAEDTCVFAGRVVDEAGQPIPGVAITVVNSSRFKFPTLARVVRTGDTADDGSFEITGLSIGRNLFTCVKPGFHLDPRQAHVYDIAMVMFFEEGERRDDVVVRMQPFTPEERVDVLLTDEDGEPIAGADVSYASIPLGPSNEEGRLVARQEAGRARVTLSSVGVRGYALAFSRDLRHAGKGITLVAVEGCTVAGRVVDAATGEPVEGAVVRCLPVDEERWPTTDSQGRFRMERCPPTKLTLLAWNETHAGETEFNPLKDPDEDLVIRVQPTGTVEGTITDAQTSRPVAGVPVSARMGVRYAARVYTDADGRYRFTAVPSGDLTIIPGNPRTGLTRGEGSRTVHVEPGQGVEQFDFRLEHPLIIRGAVQPHICGIVVDENGTPVADAAVMVFDEDSADLGRDIYNVPTLTTDISGRFSTRAYVYAHRVRLFLADVPYVVRVEHRTHVTTVVDDVVIPKDSKVKELRIVLHGGAAVAGTVLDDKKERVANAQVAAWPKGPRELRWYTITNAPTTRMAVTDAAGRYTLRGLTAGEWCVAVHHADYVQSATPQDVRIESNRATTTCDFAVTAHEKAAIEGTVVGQDGRPVPYTRLMANAHGAWDLWFSTKADGHGKFVLGNLNKGAWDISAGASLRARQRAVATGTTDALLTLPPDPMLSAVTVNGVLVDESASPITQFTISRLPNVNTPDEETVEHFSNAGRFTAKTTTRQVTFRADGYKAKRLIFDDTVEGPLDLRITMVKGAGLLEERIKADGTRTVTAGTAAAHRQRLPLAGNVTEAKEPCRWVDEGGPYGGCVVSLSLCAAEPNVLYALTNGGIFKSADGAQTWTPMGPVTIDGRSRRFPYHIVVDPTNADTAYACAETLLKSTDGAITWASIPGTKGWRFIQSLVFSAGGTNALYALPLDSAVMRSVDGGNTWEKCLDDSAMYRLRRLLADPHARGTLYAIAGGRRGIFASSDGGATWRRTAGRLAGVSVKACERFADEPQRFKLTLVCNEQECTIETINKGREWTSSDKPYWLEPGRIGVDRDDPQTLRLTLDSEKQGEVLMTRDDAKTWKALELPVEAGKLRTIGFSATQDNLLYAGTTADDYLFSDDMGETWEYFYSRKDDPNGAQTATIEELNATFPHLFGMDRSTRTRPVVVDPSHPEIGYLASYRTGVSKTVDGGATWSPANQGLTAVMISDIAVDPTAPGRLYAAGTGGVYKKAESARTWRLVHEQRQCWLVAVHPLTPRAVLSAGQEGCASISTDAGETWRPISDITGSSGIISFMFDPEDAKRFYAMSQKAIWETADAGQTWQKRAELASQDSPERYGAWGAIRQGHTSVIYRVADGKKLLRSTNLGKTWQPIDLPSSQVDIHGGQTDPKNPKVVIVHTEQAGLFLSTNAGETWSSITSPCWPACIALQPGDPSTLYIGSHEGDVLRTRDGGKTFERLGDGMPGGSVTCIVVSPADGTLFAGTSGAGICRLEIEEQTKPGKTQE